MSVPTLFLVMDMINDLVHADSPIAQQRYRGPLEAGRVLENTAEALRRARAAEARVGYVRIGFSPDYRECPPNSGVFSGSRKAGIFKLGTWGTEVHPDLAPLAAVPGDSVDPTGEPSPSFRRRLRHRNGSRSLRHRPQRCP